MGRCRALAACVAAAGLAGCSLAPVYHVPVTTVPAAFKEAGPWIVAAPADLTPRGAWWAAYGDPALDALEHRVDADNPTLAGALGRYDQAAAYLAQARSGLLPTVGLNADVTRNRQSDHRPLRGSNQPDLYPADTFGGTASYELDLWGRVRNSVAAGRDAVAASKDDLAAVKISLETSLATSYVALRGYDEQLELLSATVSAYTQADQITQRRFSGGIASGVDTSRSGTQLAEAQAQRSDVLAARAVTEHAIASLIGVPASTFSITAGKTVLAIPATPVGLPSTLLQRRPDVAAAERRMAAANAQIGVAKAAFFPSISLGGSGGFQNTGLPGLFSAPNIFWSIGPSAILNLFDGGRRRAQLAVAKALWVQSTDDYRYLVLEAFREVEDDLAQLRYLGDEVSAETRAGTQASQTERLALNRYVKGASTYLDVVTAQTTALRVRRSAIDLRTRELQASVRLMGALGGGWQSSV